MAKCFAPYYKHLLPKKEVTPLTPRQLRMINKVDPTRKAKLIGALSKYIDDGSMAALNIADQISPQRLKQLTRLGQAATEQEAQALRQIEEIRDKIDPARKQDFDFVADEIVKRYRKGDVFSEGERELVYSVFARQQQELPVLMEQLEEALALNDDDLISMFGAKYLQFVNTAAAIAGDKNAVSMIQRSYKRLNKQLMSRGTIERLFDNEAC